MNSKLSKKKVRLFVILVGICGSFLFIILGYWIAGAIGFIQTDGVSFINGLLMVLENPLGAYFNNYTPIMMMLGAIIFEFLFYLYFLRSKRDKKKKYEEKSNIKIGLENYKQNVTEQKLFEGIIDLGNDEETIFESEFDLNNITEIVIPEELTLEDKLEKEKKHKILEYEDNIAVKKEAEVSKEIIMELIEQYDMEQISAMLKIANYIENIDATMLKRMFKSSMTAEDINSYIEMFYE